MPNKRKRLKLLVVTDSLFPFTGVTKVILEIVPRLKNFESTILFPKEKGSSGYLDKIGDVQLVRVKKIFYFKDHPFAGIDKKVRGEVIKSDVVWVNISGPLGMQTISAAKKLGKPVIAYHHLFEEEIFRENVNFWLKPLSPILRKAINIFYNKCDLILVPSKNVGIEILNKGIKTRRKVVRLGVDLPKKINKVAARRKLKLDKDSVYIGYLGGIREEKDLGTLLDAYNILKEKDDKVKLLIIGSGNKEIVDMLKANGAIVTGFVKNPALYLHALDVFVLPSLTETTSLATLEAMACGLPVIATRVGYVKNYLNNGKNGLFFRKSDPVDLSEKIKVVLRRDKLREKLGKNAKKTAREFSWKKTVSEINKAVISVYREYGKRK